MAKPMRVYFDFEFLEDYQHIDPISLGMVREDGRELYIVFNSFDTLAVANNDWLMANVMTSIDHVEVTSHTTGTGRPVKDLVITDRALRSKAQARDEILQFVCDIWPEFWAWYGAYDHVALCSLFGRMVDLPANFPMFTNDIKQLHKKAGSPKMPRQPVGHHNALDDARYNIVRHKYLHLLGANGPDLYVDRETGEWIWPDQNEKPPQELLDHAYGTHQGVVWAWMQGPAGAHWEPRWTGAVVE